MAKFSHILKLQSGGTFKSYSAALPTDTQLRDIGPYAPSQEEAAQSGLATPEFPDMDLSDIENAEGYTGDKQEILGEAMRIQNKIKINLANNPLYRDSAEFTKDLGDLQYYKYFGKNNIIQQYKSGERYMEMMEKTYHNKDMYLMDSNGNYGTIQDDGSVAYVRPEVAFTDPKRMIQYETIADQRHFNTSITKNYLLEKVINVNGNAVADKELAELFSEVKSTVTENGSDSFGQYVVDGKVLDVLKGNVNKTTTNAEGLLALASIIENRMSPQTRNTYITKTWQVMSYKYGGADGLKEVMTSGDEEAIKKFRKEYSQEYMELVLQAASGHYERSNKNSIKGIPGGGSGSDNDNTKTTPYTHMTSGQYGPEAVVVGQAHFASLVGPDALITDNFKPTFYHSSPLKRYTTGGKEGVTIIGSKNTDPGADGELLQYSVLNKVNYIPMYPLHNGKPIAGIHANPRKDAKLSLHMKTLEDNLKLAQERLKDATSQDERDEHSKTVNEYIEELSNFYSKNNVLGITGFGPVAIVEGSVADGDYTAIGRKIGRGDLTHLPKASANDVKLHQSLVGSKVDSGDYRQFKAIITLNPFTSPQGEIGNHQVFGDTRTLKKAYEGNTPVEVEKFKDIE